MKSSHFLFAAAGALLSLANPAHAAYGIHTADPDGAGGRAAITYEEVRFYTPNTAATPTYVGTPGSQDLCTAGLISADVCAKTLSFDTAFGGTLTATATFKDGKKNKDGVVYQDLSPGYGGLGVSDKITLWGSTPVGGATVGLGDKLTLTFSQEVTIVGMHFFDVFHTPIVNPWQRTGFLSIDGAAAFEIDLGSYLTSDPARYLTGTSFTFSTNGLVPDYHVGSLKLLSPVPEPETYAMLLAGLGVLGFMARRRRG